MKADVISKLIEEKSKPCVTISLNTHRTHPERMQDEIELKNLCKEAENKLVKEFDKREIASLLSKLESLPKELDVTHNLDSVHIFLSNNTKEVLKSIWKTNTSGVHIAESFAIRPLINSIYHNEEYLILLLSQSGVHLFRAANDAIIEEVKNGDFPFKENQHYITDQTKMSDQKAHDLMVKEYLNKVDKALVKYIGAKKTNCVIISTKDNHSFLMEVADKPNIYSGNVAIDYNNVNQHQIAAQGWEVMKDIQKISRSNAIVEMKAAVSQGKVLTDIIEIYKAAKEGRADLLIINESFKQSAIFNGDSGLELVSDANLPNAVDDISSHLAIEVIKKGGRVITTGQDELNDIGKIALKIRHQ